MSDSRETSALRSGGRRLSAFPYPGGKTPYIDEILQYFPDHRRYVEPFGGSAAILLNKPESYIEVFNGRNDDIVHFFRVVRKQRDELVEWLRRVPYSRRVHKEWTTAFYNGFRPDDDIERAGRWFYLRYTQYGGKLADPSGFKSSGKRNEARTFRGAIDHLKQVVNRLQIVNIECEDYQDVLHRYDRSDTLNYLDPPYVDKGHYYGARGFDHQELFDHLFEIDGFWIVSYGELPDIEVPDEDIGGIHFREFDVYHSLDVRETESRTASTEHLVMNFDPDAESKFSPVGQTTLPGTGGGLE